MESRVQLGKKVLLGEKIQIRVFALICLLVITFSLMAAGQGEGVNNDPDKVMLRLSGGDWGLPSPYRHYHRGPGIFKMQLIYDSSLEVLNADGSVKDAVVSNGTLHGDNERVFRLVTLNFFAGYGEDVD